MAFDAPIPPPSPPPRPEAPDNALMMTMLQQRLGAMTLAMVELEARLHTITQERDELRARVSSDRAAAKS